MKPKRGYDFLYYQLDKYPQTDSINSKKEGKWKSYSTSDVIDIVNELSLGLLNKGITQGDKVAIVSNNRPEWNFVDLAIQQIGAVTVPMYPTITVEDYKYIFEHSESKFAFVENSELFEKVKKSTQDFDVEVCSFESLEGCSHWSEVQNLGKEASEEEKDKLEKIKESVSENDLITIIYTSGTTGRPKGVMLSHKNIVSNVLAVFLQVRIQTATARSISFLPLSHVYERVGFHLYLYSGVSIYYAESIETIGDNIREIKPHVFNTVPRVLEKVYDKIMAKGHSLSGVTKSLFFWAIDLGQKYKPNEDQGFWYNFKLAIARKLIFSKWQEALGGNITLISVGGAALQPRLATIFWAAGIKVCEGYGLTESSPVITAPIPEEDEIRMGCVGVPIDGVKVKIADDGEILCKGDNVMQGYYKQPDITSETIKDGWLHTGDIGEFVEGKYLKITDRKKEMFKTSGGKYIAPQLMENKFKESFLIEQIMVTGDARKFPSALIVPSFEALQEWCKEKKINYTSPNEMINNPKIKEKIDQEVQKKNESFAQWEKIKKHVLLPELWSIETGEMTPKLSLKRRVICKKFEEEIEGMYQE